MALGARGSFPTPCNGSGWDCRRRGCICALSGESCPHPLSTGAGGWQGLPRLSTQLSPVRVKSSSRYGCYGASFLLLFLAGRPGRARGGRGTAVYTRGEFERRDQSAGCQEVLYFLPTPSNHLAPCLTPYLTPSPHTPTHVYTYTLTLVVGLGSKVTSWRELLLFRVGLQ